VDLPDQVDICIDELVLEGFDLADGFTLAEGIQRANERLLAERELPPRGLVWRAAKSVESVHRREFVLESGSDPRDIGEAVGGQVYRRLDR